LNTDRQRTSGAGPGPDTSGARRRRSRWTSFVAEVADGDQAVRSLHEEGNPDHRLRVEHDRATLLIHLSGEDGEGWTTIAVDRTTRRTSVAHGARQADTARAAYEELHGK